MKSRKLSNSKHLAAENNIVNLSTYTLSKHELSLLNKGLSFIPKPKRIDTDDIKEGISKLKNQMISKTIKKQHRSLNSTVPDSYNPFLTLNKFREKPKNRDSSQSTNQTLNSFLKKTDETVDNILHHLTQSHTDNLTRGERIALKNLMENDEIIINKADKGSTIVILNKSDYLEQEQRQTNSTTRHPIKIQW